MLPAIHRPTSAWLRNADNYFIVLRECYVYYAKRVSHLEHLVKIIRNIHPCLFILLSLLTDILV